MARSPIAAFLAVPVVFAAHAAAQPYEIPSFTVDGGGGTLQGDIFTLSGTTGQPDAGVLQGSRFSISGGFWSGLGELPGCNLADIAEPFGVLDLNDVTGFVGAFLAGEPPADLAEPFGVIDLSDISAFVGEFLAGCP